jgi:hypothetical protein
MDAITLKALIEEELQHLSDARVLAHIRSLVVEPSVVLRDWDYGDPLEQYPCWTVLNHDPSNTGIAYCEHGFGPLCPWGLVALRDDNAKDMSMGMDSGWFSTLLDAYFDSYASADLPIWRVFKTSAAGVPEPITPEHTWDAAWEQVNEFRKSDPASRYDCGHSILCR